MGFVSPGEAQYGVVLHKIQESGNPLSLPKVAAPESTAGAIANDTIQFIAGFIPAMRAASFIKPATADGAVAKGMAVGAVVDASVFDPHEPRLSDIISTYPQLKTPITEYLRSYPTDSGAKGRLKNAVEGLIAGAAAERFLKALKLIKKANRAGAVGASKSTSRIVITSQRQLQKKFRHASDFGVTGNYSIA